MRMEDYEDDDDSDMIPGESLLSPRSISLNVGDSVRIRSKRFENTVITLTNSCENSPKRDAALLESFLSSALEEPTWNALLDIIWTKYLSTIVTEQYSKFIGANGMIKVPPTTRKKRVKKALGNENTDSV